MVAHWGGCAWLFRGGMHGCSWGECMVAPRGGMHACRGMRDEGGVPGERGGMCGERGGMCGERGGMPPPHDIWPVIARAVRILLECILVSI